MSDVAGDRRGAPSKGDGAKRYPLTIPLTRDLYVRLSNYARDFSETRAAAARRLIEEGVGGRRAGM